MNYPVLLTIDHDIFEPMRDDFNTALERLFSIMNSTNRKEGKISLTMNVELSPQMYTDPDTGEFKVVDLPQFIHKFKVSVKNEGSVEGVSIGDYELTIRPDGAMIAGRYDGQENMFEKEGN